MRMMGFLMGLVALVAPAWSQDMYRWTDGAGTVHYSNTSSGNAHATRIPSVASPASEERPASGDVASAGSAGDAEAFSADASLRRNALERDVRATERRLGELDARLAAFARARGQNARGSAATGGVGTNAVDVRSEEERALADERERVAQHAAEVRNEAAQLRQEVLARFGGTAPPWWIDVR